MNFTPTKINLFLIAKLPSAFICGVRVFKIDFESCVTTIKLNWINKNPFKSMFWAAQGMAAELATGIIIMKTIKDSKKNISMLVATNKAAFYKKATHRIFFECKEVEKAKIAVQKAIKTNESQTVWLNSIGKNKNDEIVSVFDFEWTLKVKN